MHIYSFIFTPTFPLGRVEGIADLGGLEIPHCFQKSQVALLAAHQHGTKQGLKCSHATWSLVNSPLVYPTALASPIFRRTFWSHGRTNAAGISRFGGKVPRHSVLYEFHSCGTVLQSVTRHRELFANIPSLPLVLEIALFQSLHKIHDHRLGSEHRPI